VSYNYGMECLFRFWSYGLEKRFKAEIYSDFEEAALRDYKNNNLYGLEKFWAFHFYRKSSDPIAMGQELQQLLDAKFSTLEDFAKAKEALAKEARAAAAAKA
jgi:la-related protein 1